MQVTPVPAEVHYTLTLTQAEAEWLKTLTQNHMVPAAMVTLGPDVEESHEDRIMRGKFWTALDRANVK